MVGICINQDHIDKKYPCHMCVVRACCITPCGRLNQNKPEIYKILVKEGYCPDCRSERLEMANVQRKKCLGCGHVFILVDNIKMSWRDESK